MQPYAISVDWLQVYCITDTYELENFVPIFPTDYKIIKMSYGTRQFKNVYEVYCDEREPNNSIKHNGNYKINSKIRIN